MLDEAVGQLNNTKNFIMEVQGFTDTTGSAAMNLELSRKRADEVVRYVTLKHNIPLRRIHVLGLGEDAPNADNSNRAARKQNRRVDINVYARAIDGSTAGATGGSAANSTSLDQGSSTIQDRSRTSGTTGSTSATTGTTTPQTTGTTTPQTQE